MSARDLIHAYLMSGYEDWAEPHKARISPKVMAEAEELYEAVAHELAEKQRAWLADPSNRAALESEGAGTLPDLIDPQKEGQ